VQAATIWLSAYWSAILTAGDKPAHSVKITWNELVENQTPPQPSSAHFDHVSLGLYSTPEDAKEYDSDDMGYAWRHGIEKREMFEEDEHKTDYKSTFVVSAKVCPTPANKLTVHPHPQTN
jgi:hypothetical protein